MGNHGRQAWLGDLVRAVAGLRAAGLAPDVPEIRKMLGLPDVRVRQPADASAPLPRSASGEAPESSDPAGELDEELDSVLPDGELRQIPAHEPLDLPEDEEQRHVTGHGEFEPTYNENLPMPWKDHNPLPRADTVRTRKPLPFTALLRPGATRGVIQGALSTPEPEGEIDVDAVVDDLACARPVHALPRRPRLTLRFGVQVLLDRSTGMHPFLTDQDHLAHQIRHVAGAHATTEWFFEASPEVGRSGTGDHQYRAPYGGRVLVVSGFGIVPGTRWFSDRDEWIALTGVWRRRGVRPVALVPFPVHRVPHWLRALMPVITWDRTTTVGTVRVALSAGAR